MVQYLAPGVGQDLVLMDILEDLDLVTATVDVEPVLVSDKGVVSSSIRQGALRLVLSVWEVLGVRVHLAFPFDRCCNVWADFEPLVVLNLVLEQVVEVGASFPSVSSKEEEAITVRDGPGSRSRLGLIANGALVGRRLVIHGYVPRPKTSQLAYAILNG